MGGRSAERRGYGLVVLAAILLAVIGCFNLIYGIAAIAKRARVRGQRALRVRSRRLMREAGTLATVSRTHGA